jgi:hypothetical protein
MLGNEFKNRTFKALVDYYAKQYSPGQIANQLCDVMDGMSTPVHAEAAQWTIDAARAMAGERSFWKREIEKTKQCLTSTRPAKRNSFESAEPQSKDKMRDEEIFVRNG